MLKHLLSLGKVSISVNPLPNEMFAISVFSSGRTPLVITQHNTNTEQVENEIIKYCSELNSIQFEPESNLSSAVRSTKKKSKTSGNKSTTLDAHDDANHTEEDQLERSSLLDSAVAELGLEDTVNNEFNW